MNKWEVAAIVLGAGLLPCLAVCVFARPFSGLAALEVASTLAVTVLILLSVGLHRQSFVDLAVVLAPLSMIASIAFARLMERHL
jgi:multisubunit Na+/H+ antiporter MnhF subunit